MTPGSATEATVDRTRATGREFVALVTCMMATGAIGIDLMLPAFADMRTEFGMTPDSTHVGWIITAYFLGMAVGPWLYGPISDRHGRRMPLLAGLGVYVLAAAMAALAPSFGWIIVSRFVWGLGAAAPRVLSLAMLRDRYHGAGMARLMSMIMAVFLLVPILAPGLGAGLNAIAPWRIVFWAPAALAAALAVWVFKRLPETLTVEQQRPFNRASLTEAIRTVLHNRQTMCFALAITFLFAVMTSYLAGSELIVREVYGYGAYYPLFFGVVGIVLALSSLNNARLVGKVGVTVLVRRMAVVGVVLASMLTVVAFTGAGRPNFWLFSSALALTVPLAQGLVPNANTAAMMPMRHVAGTASAVIGTISTAGGALLGGLVTSTFDGTVRPFAIGILLLISASTLLVLFGATSRGPSTGDVAIEPPLL